VVWEVAFWREGGRDGRWEVFDALDVGIEVGANGNSFELCLERHPEGLIADSFDFGMADVKVNLGRRR